MRWIPLPMVRGSLNAVRELRLLFHLVGLYRREAPEIVHNFTIKCVVYGSIAARLTGIRRRINAIAGMGYVFTGDSLSARLLRPLVRLLMKIAMGGSESRLILQNKDDCAVFDQYRLVEKTRVRLIRGSGVNTDQFRPFSDERKQHTFRVIFAARLLWDKGVREYVEAARLLRESGLAIEFLLAGVPDPGNPAAVNERQVRDWNDAGLIRALGHVDDMVHWLHQADLAVLPSYYREGVPKSLIEAAACGLPIITTDAPGCREIVEQGVNGLLVPCRDANALAEAIRRLHDDPNQRRRMGAAGRAKVLAEFDERIVLSQTLCVYRELMPKDSGTLVLDE